MNEASELASARLTVRISPGLWEGLDDGGVWGRHNLIE